MNDANLSPMPQTKKKAVHNKDDFFSQAFWEKGYLYQMQMCTAMVLQAIHPVLQ